LDALGGAFDLVVGIDLVGRPSLTFESLWVTEIVGGIEEPPLARGKF
jgi:hypothetical protein